MNVLETFEEGDNDLYEKYNANQLGKEGGGGEYSVQKGFGWTNGVLVEFICAFGDDLLLQDKMAALEAQKLIAPGWKQLACARSVQSTL